MTQKHFFVYTHSKPNTTDVHGIFYVGKGNENRVSKINRLHNNHHKNIVAKYGKENIIVRKLICKSEQHAFDLEIQMIAILRKIGVEIVNLSDGGEGSSGHAMTTEAKKKLSLLNKGRIHTSEAKKKISASQIGHKRMLGYKHSEETRAKVSEALRNRPPISEETRAKLSASKKGRAVSAEAREKMSKAAKNRPPVSTETKEKLSKALTGRPVSEKTREKISTGNKNRAKPSDETLKRMSDAQKGKKLSPEHRAKMSASQKKAHERRRLEKLNSENKDDENQSMKRRSMIL